MSGWSEPRTWAAGEVVTATLLNTELRDNLKYIGGTDTPRARVFRSTNQSISDSTATAITHDSERYDIGSLHSTSSNTSRLTVPAGGDGLWCVGGCAEFAANATGSRILDIWVNGSTNPLAAPEGCISGDGDTRRC
jgi:hypothetical protein